MMSLMKNIRWLDITAAIILGFSLILITRQLRYRTFLSAGEGASPLLFGAQVAGPFESLTWRYVMRYDGGVKCSVLDSAAKLLPEDTRFLVLTKDRFSSVVACPFTKLFTLDSLESSSLALVMDSVSASAIPLDSEGRSQYSSAAPVPSVSLKLLFRQSPLAPVTTQAKRRLPERP